MFLMISQKKKKKKKKKKKLVKLIVLICFDASIWFHEKILQTSEYYLFSFCWFFFTKKKSSNQLIYKFCISVSRKKSNTFSYFELFERCKWFHKKKIIMQLSLLHSVKKRKIYSHWKNISSNQLFSNSISKTVGFTKFLPKICESKLISVISTLCAAARCCATQIPI